MQTDWERAWNATAGVVVLAVTYFCLAALSGGLAVTLWWGDWAGWDPFMWAGLFVLRRGWPCFLIVGIFIWASDKTAHEAVQFSRRLGIALGVVSLVLFTAFGPLGVLPMLIIPTGVCILAGYWNWLFPE